MGTEIGYGFVSAGAITAICYLIAEAIKMSPMDRKWLPIICAVLGMFLGIGAYFLHIPDFPAADPFNAAAIGIVSGFTATGVNQVYKQLHD